MWPACWPTRSTPASSGAGTGSGRTSLTCPGADFFAAGRDGHPVAVAGTGRIGDLVGVYAVGTRKAQRRRGAAAAAVSAAIDHHVARGAHLFCLVSAPAAEPLYRGLGFTVVDHPDVWHVPAG